MVRAPFLVPSLLTCGLVLWYVYMLESNVSGFSLPSEPSWGNTGLSQRQGLPCVCVACTYLCSSFVLLPRWTRWINSMPTGTYLSLEGDNQSSTTEKVAGGKRSVAMTMLGICYGDNGHIDTAAVFGFCFVLMHLLFPYNLKAKFILTSRH